MAMPTGRGSANAFAISFNCRSDKTTFFEPAILSEYLPIHFRVHFLRSRVGIRGPKNARRILNPLCITGGQTIWVVLHSYQFSLSVWTHYGLVARAESQSASPGLTRSG